VLARFLVLPKQAHNKEISLKKMYKSYILLESSPQETKSTQLTPVTEKVDIISDDIFFSKV